MLARSVGEENFSATSFHYSFIFDFRLLLLCKAYFRLLPFSSDDDDIAVGKRLGKR